MWAKNANIIYKQDKARGRQAAPSQITSDGRADRLGILSKNLPLKKAVSKERKILSENMEKTAIRFESKLKNEIQNMMNEANATSMADFVRQATEFYIAYLRQKKSIDFFAPLLAQTIKNEIESVEKNISSMLFKLSVEQAIVNNITLE
ncbi:MAG: hypothetical protein HDT48_01515 [Ruminococcaceae bacterium]|nr:hypothetical protein [Oscillospiraceae bacterium]